MKAKQFYNIWVPVTGSIPSTILDHIKESFEFKGKNLIGHPALRIEEIAFANPNESENIRIPVDIPFIMTSADEFSVLVPCVKEISREGTTVIYGGEYRITNPALPTLTSVAVMLDEEGGALPYPLAGVTICGYVYVE